MRKNGSDNRMALLLTLPMVIYLLGYLFNHDPGLVPTGFIMHDNVGYIAYAKQYLDNESFSLFYNNPFNESANYPAIYFQPHTTLFAAFLALKIPAGYILIPFMLLCSFFFFRVMIKLHDLLLPFASKRWLTILLFAWGGGLLAIAGIPAALIKPEPGLDFFENIFILDPGWGWWALNAGRALFIGCEAFYHLLFFTVVLMVLKKKWTTAFIFSVLVSISHPFTGIELLAIICAWTFLEKLAFRNSSIPWWFFIASVLLIALHAWYYLIYLNQFADHRSVSEQYALNWRLRYFSIIPAYALVAILALVSIRISGIRAYFSKESNRLFFSWFLVAFLLANHELFMKPMQPLHFTRGYVWTALFLMGLPALNLFVSGLRKQSYRPFVFIFIALMLSDNFLWILNDVRFKREKSSETHITIEQRELLSAIDKHSNNETLILGTDLIPYMSTIYSSAYPWISHPFTTPFSAIKKDAMENFMENGIIAKDWVGRDCIFIFRKSNAGELDRMNAFSTQKTLIWDSPEYKVYKTKL